VTAVAVSIEEIRRGVADARSHGWSVGLVPTMGALHEGHASLIRVARQETGCVVVSLFVNPAQFGPAEDFSRYPRPFDNDLELCRRERVDLLFAPPVEEVYPPGYHTHVEVEGLQDVLCGASRPGHFRGVCTVVQKLFSMVGPDLAYFGQKDAQQVVILQQMVRDLNVPIRLRVCPTVREPDGLALSSRNRYLSAQERWNATTLIEALRAAKVAIEAGQRDGASVQQLMADHIRATPLAVLDYAAVVDARTLQSAQHIEGKVLLALAVRFGGARLIDNLVLDVSADHVVESSLQESLVVGR